MKKALKIIGACCVAMILMVGIHLSIPPKTLDFRGTVTEIETTVHETVLHIASSTGASYIVTADSQTHVLPCHQDDPGIDLADISVGDTIEGDYRSASNDDKAKFITVWLHH